MTTEPLYNVGKRKDRQITNYYEKIRQGKQEKLFHEVIFQIGNCEDMAVGTVEGELAVKVLNEYMQDFSKKKIQQEEIRFSRRCYFLHFRNSFSDTPHFSPPHVSSAIRLQ